jgi:hypothetical protein
MKKAPATELVRIRKDILEKVLEVDWRTPEEIALERTLYKGVKVDRALQKALLDKTKDRDRRVDRLRTRSPL